MKSKFRKIVQITALTLLIAFWGSIQFGKGHPVFASVFDFVYRAGWSGKTTLSEDTAETVHTGEVNFNGKEMDYEICVSNQNMNTTIDRCRRELEAKGYECVLGRKDNLALVKFIRRTEQIDAVIWAEDPDRHCVLFVLHYTGFVYPQNSNPASEKDYPVLPFSENVVNLTQKDQLNLVSLVGFRNQNSINANYLFIKGEMTRQGWKQIPTPLVPQKNREKLLFLEKDGITCIVTVGEDPMSEGRYVAYFKIEPDKSI